MSVHLIHPIAILSLHALPFLGNRKELCCVLNFISNFVISFSFTVIKLAMVMFIIQSLTQ